MNLNLIKNKILIFTVIGLLLQGCYSYNPVRIDPDEIIKEVSISRNNLSVESADTDSFTLQDAALVMSDKNPELALLRRAYKGASEVADTWAPLPNPKVEAGVNIGFDLDDGGNGKDVQPFVGLGFTIPLGPRISRLNNLNEVLKERSFNNLLATHRELYLNLRRNYINYIVSRERLTEQEKIVATLQNTQRVGSKLLKLGTINSLGLNSINIEYNRVVLDRIDREITLVEETAALSELMGVSSDLFENKSVISLPELSDSLPELQELKELMLKHNTSLSRLELQYKVDYAALRLEVARRIPDLDIGAGYEQEVGEDKKVLGTGLGIELPIFDRNQQGIIEAQSRQDNTRLAYKSEMNKALNRLESGIKRYRLYLKQYKEIESHLIPLSQKNIRSAERALRIGSLDILLFLELQKEYRDLLIKQIDLKKSLWDALLDIENITGYPIYMFPDEEENLKHDLKEGKNE